MPDPLRILIAEDDVEMRRYLARSLRRLGAPIITEAANGREALDRAQAHVPDLVIADLQMPVLDGAALCRALKEVPETASVPVLLITGDSRAQPTCADAVLVKPFNAVILRRQIGDLISIPAA